MTPALPAPAATHRDCLYRRSWGTRRALGTLRAWQSWGTWRAFRACRTDRLSSDKDIAGVRDPKESSGPGSNQVPAASVMKFSSSPGLCLGCAPHTHVTTTLPLDPGLGLAEAHHAAAFLGVALDAAAARADTHHAAASCRLAKYPVTVRRTGPEQAGGRLA